MNDTHNYLPRVVDAEIAASLRALPAVVLEGPRACGKTSTGRQHTRSEVLFGSDRTARLASGIDPEGLLTRPEPILLDEWQLAPDIWNHVRAAADEGRRPGRFILTGSAVPADDVTRHSGAGRVRRVRMRPMSLYESGLSTGAVPMASLFDASTKFAPRAEPSLRDIVEATCRGGWPACTRLDTGAAQQYCEAYLSEICRADIPLLEGPARDPVGVGRLLRSMARNTSTEASQRTLARDTGTERTLDPRTAGAYLEALRRVFVAEDLPAWSTRLRSRASLRRAPKRHLTDPSLAVAALAATPSQLWNDLETFGLLFESMAVRDLRVYAQAARGRVFHYRDGNNLEVDAIIERADGSWIAVEVKLGGEPAVEKAAASLLKLRRTVDTAAAGEPCNLIVVTSTGYGYRRPDGVLVIPLTTLGP